ncbi:MAG: hypothetical protein OSA99_09685 [Acidimicrobiales bacterium]|nr:hypothetical protein [Acidimicrobiales bacterium]
MAFTTRSARRVASAFLPIVLLAAACGDDDADGASTATTEAGTDTADPAAPDGSADAASTDDTAVGLFFDGALADDVVTVDCTLSDGTETSCYEITVSGIPADTGVGDFCPTTTDATEDDAGIWFDGENVYDIDGEFILDLPEIYDDENWHLHDDDGHVHVTDTQEAFEAAARPDVAAEYQNFCVEGRIEWLENGEPITTTVEIPVTPIASDSTTAASAPLGVTYSGVRIDGSAPVDAILGAYTIAAFDDCGGHINPFEGYHLHAATGCGEVGDVAEGETAAFGIAIDGYSIHSPLDDAALADADLDECNGHSTDETGYHYHAYSAEENNVLTCFTGVTVAGATGGGPGGGPQG